MHTNDTGMDSTELCSDSSFNIPTVERKKPVQVNFHHDVLQSLMETYKCMRFQIAHSIRLYKMKYYIVVTCVVAQLIIANCKTLPDHFPEPCSKTEKDYTACALKGINKLGPYILKGIPKYNIPKLDPLEISQIVVNRTLNEFLSIQAVIKNIKIYGLSATYINDFKTDVKSLSGEIKFTVPGAYLSMDYNVAGQLLAIPLRSRGFFKGNFTNGVTHIKGSVKTVTRDGVQYFTLDKFKLKSSIEDGYVKLISKNSNDQLAADIISNFYNENPRRTMEALNPLYVETASNFVREILEQGLGKVPAAELLPE